MFPRGKAIIVLTAVFFNDDDVTITITLHYQKATFQKKKKKQHSLPLRK